MSWVQQVYPAGGVTYSGATSVFEQNGNTNGAESKKERKSVWKVYRVETRPNAMTGEETEQSVLGRDLPRPRHSSAGGPWVHAHRREASCLCWEMSTHRLSRHKSGGAGPGGGGRPYSVIWEKADRSAARTGELHSPRISTEVACWHRLSLTAHWDPVSTW